MSTKKPSVTKSELVSDIVSKTGLTKTQVNDFFEVLTSCIDKYVKSGNSVTIPNLVKIYVHKKKASPARQMKSPATGEMITVSAKPAKKVIKTKPVKYLKELI
jgi:nucleoid DNA-binding protein